MARYCFYCGREIAPGEKCSCKGPDNGAGSNDAKAPAPKNKRKKPKIVQNSDRHARKNARHIGRILQSLSARIATLRDQLATNLPTLTRGVLSFVQYVTRPVGKIRHEALEAKRRFSWLQILFFILLTGTLALMFSRSGSVLFVQLVILGLSCTNAFFFASPLIAFIAICALCFYFFVLLAFVFFLSARLTNRKPSLRKIFSLLSISLIYVIAVEIFLFVALLLGSRGTLSILLISLILMSITHFISFRHALGLPEDATFIYLIFVYMTYFLFVRLSLFIVQPIFISLAAL